jgi:anti-sigma28 factor (negative regulator of flagellin synthesis)
MAQIMSQIESGKRRSTPWPAQLSGVESLSPDQAVIRQLVSHLSQVPEVRQEKVNALQSEIQAGLFQRSDEQVAGAVVSQLLGINSNV